MVANLVVFMSAIVFVEPWKRRRLAETFERRVVDLAAEVGSLVEKEVGALREELRRGAGAVGEGERAVEVETVEKSEERAREEQSALLSQLIQEALSSLPPTDPTDPPPPPTSTTSRLLPSLPSLPSLSSLTSTSPSAILDFSSASLASSAAFVRTGWANDGLERDAMVLGGAGFAVGGLVAAVVCSLLGR